MMMRFSLLAASAVLALSTTVAFAAPQATKSSKLADCSHANKGKTGQAYKDGVKACMAGDTHVSKKPTLTDCSHANKGKTGQAYKDGVKSCMAGH